MQRVATASRRHRSGVALVVVLWTVVVLATVTAVASSAARGSSRLVTNLRSAAIARAMAESGIVAATSLIDDSLATFASDSVHRDAFLARLEPSAASASPVPLLQDTLSDGVFAVTVVDVSARLDVNDAGVEGMTTLLRAFVGDVDARRLAGSIAARVRGSTVGTSRRTAEGSLAGQGREEAESRAERDSLGAVLLGRAPSSRARTPLQSLDELLEISGFDEALLARVASYLTVDGDGRVNRSAAPALVRAAASGSLVDRPSRVLCIARGWQAGQPLTREIQAVYDVADDGLRLVRWRETSR
jgi:general secretion pathway protein K